MRKVRKVHSSPRSYAFRQGIAVYWVGKIPPLYKSNYVMRLNKKSPDYEYEIQMNFQVYQSEKRK